MEGENRNINEETLRMLRMRIYFKLRENHKTQKKSQREMTKIIRQMIEVAVENDN